MTDNILMIRTRYDRKSFETHISTVCKEEVDGMLANFQSNQNIEKTFLKFTSMGNIIAYALASTRVAASNAAIDVNELLNKYQSFLHGSTVSLRIFIEDGFTCLNFHGRAFEHAKRNKFDRSIREMKRCQEIAEKNVKETTQIIGRIEELKAICTRAEENTLKHSNAGKQEQKEAERTVKAQREKQKGFDDRMNAIRKEEQNITEEIKKYWEDSDRLMSMEEKKLRNELVIGIINGIFGNNKDPAVPSAPAMIFQAAVPQAAPVAAMGKAALNTGGKFLEKKVKKGIEKFFKKNATETQQSQSQQEQKNWN